MQWQVSRVPAELNYHRFHAIKIPLLLVPRSPALFSHLAQQKMTLARWCVPTPLLPNTREGSRTHVETTQFRGRSSVTRTIISEINPLITWYGQEVINGSDVIDSIRQHANLLLPLLFEEIHVFLSQLALGFSSQSQRSVNDLQNTSEFLKHTLHETVRFHMFIQWTQQRPKQA